MAGITQVHLFFCPFLYLISINDKVNELDTKFRLFADDTSIYIGLSTPANTV